MVLEIAIVSGKGGVGKSTLAASIAIILAQKGMNIIAVDADAEAPNLHLVLGVERWDREESIFEGRIATIDPNKCIKCGHCRDVCRFNAIEYVDNQYVVNRWICEGCMACAFVCPTKAIKPIYKVKTGTVRIAYRTIYGFPLISSSIPPGRPNSGKLVLEAKNRARELVKEKDHIIIVDAAAGIGCQVISSLSGADLAIIVTEPTPASFSDFKRIHRLTKHFGIPAALVLNKYDLNIELSKEIEKYAIQNRIYILGRIPYDDLVPRSLTMMKPLILCYPNSKATKAILDIGQKLYEVIVNWSKWVEEYRPLRPEPLIPIIIKPGEST